MVKWVNNGQMGKYRLHIKQQYKQVNNDNKILWGDFSNNY